MTRNPDNMLGLAELASRDPTTPILPRMRNQALPRIENVIISSEKRGDGKDTVLRCVILVHTLEGEFIAEHDPFPDQPEGK